MQNEDRRDELPKLAADSPTEMVEDERGQVFERLSSGTATLLLAWLIGVGALTTLLGGWLFVWAATGEQLGLGALFGGFGFYVALAGASGPCILWLTGRAQGHSLAWFALTAAKMALVMVGIVMVMVMLATLLLAGALPGSGALAAAAIMVVMALAVSVVWAAATWAADRWIARARIAED
ncbi:MAG: hypothetical protein ACRDGV_12795 [Candidatus Limnocylindria bacterium]